MGPTWVLSAPDGPHGGPMNLAIMYITDIFFFQTTIWMHILDENIHILMHCIGVLFVGSLNKVLNKQSSCLWLLSSSPSSCNIIINISSSVSSSPLPPVIIIIIIIIIITIIIHSYHNHYTQELYQTSAHWLTFYNSALRISIPCPVNITDSKVHGANMGPTWVLSAPGGPPVGSINLAVRDGMHDRKPYETKKNNIQRWLLNSRQLKLNIHIQIIVIIVTPINYTRK